MIDCGLTAPGEHMEILFQDIRYAFRMMRRGPAFTIVAILTLALGIGATSAIFSVASAVLLRPLPYQNSERLVWISGNNLPGGIKSEAASGPDYLDWANQNKCFEQMACFSGWQPTLTDEGEPERIPGSAVSVNMFDLLGKTAYLGRTFLADEDQDGKDHVVILSYGLWQRRFGGDPSVIGRSLTLNGNQYLVAGVMPSDFRYLRTALTDIWTAQTSASLARQQRRSDFLGVVARLKGQVTFSQAQAEMNSIAEELEHQYPASNTGWRITVMPLHERTVGQIRPALLVLLAAVGFLLLIACANVSNLLLVRATARQKEIAIRTALGGLRARLIRQLLTESVLLGLLGGAAGLVLAFLGVKGLVAISPRDLPRIAEVGIDRVVLGFTLVVSLVTGIGFGLAPALQIANPTLSESLKEGGRDSSAGSHGHRARSVLTIAEVSLALVLLVCSGLMIRSFVRLQKVNPGFNTERLLTMRLSLPRARFADGAPLAAFYQELLEKVKALPGIQSASESSDLPIANGDNYLAFVVQGDPPLPPGTNQDAEFVLVAPDYFETMGIPLLAGRQPSDRDGAGTPPVAVVSEAMVRRYWPDQNPIGKVIGFGGPNKFEIVGIVGSTKTEGLNEPPYPQIYGLYTQVPQRTMSLVVRTSGDPQSLVAPIRGLLRSIDKDQPLFNVKTMEEILSESIAGQRLNTLLLGIFAALALILAGVGIYGVMSYSVKQRTHEIGVRMALGAGAGKVVRMVVLNGMTLAGIGIIVGLGAAFALARLMTDLLFGVSPSDPATFAGISGLIGLVALLACYLPARRATKVDPMLALRYE
jgi:putative ABC transport system permease protein